MLNWMTINLVGINREEIIEVEDVSTNIFYSISRQKVRNIKTTFALVIKEKNVILYVLMNRATDFLLRLKNLEILHMQHLNENVMEILNLKNLEKDQIFVLEKL